MGQEAIGFLVFQEFKSSLVQKFELFPEFGLFGEFCETCKNTGDL